VLKHLVDDSLQICGSTTSLVMGVVLAWSLSIVNPKVILMMKIQTLITALALTAGGVVFAQTPTPATPNLDKREARQQKRIDQGVASGQLTNRLDKREAKLAADEAAAKSDGKVTRAERHKLQREADRDSLAIHRQKHDKQTAMNVTK
jgi:hypothetical protein